MNIAGFFKHVIQSIYDSDFLVTVLVRYVIGIFIHGHKMNSFQFYARRILLKTIHFIVWLYAFIINFGKRKVLPPIRNPILWKSATKLAEDIREERLTSEEVVRAYVERIKEVQPIINAVVEERFEDALSEAREVDDLIKSVKFTKKQLEKEKPLLGVPFTVKCLIAIKDLRNTSGSLMFKDRIAKEDAESVALLKKKGGIALALTNSPEFGAGIETCNLLYGTTSNPYDTARTCGGSSGGEAALVSSAGSILGIGNDLMGSNRLPAHFCGLFAHKTTAGLISNKGCRPLPPPSMGYLLSTGPICRYAEDLDLALRILSAESKEKYVHRDSVDFKKLKIYYQTEMRNPWVQNPDKEIVQAVKKAVFYFEKHGAVVQEVNIPLLRKTTFIAYHLLVSEITNRAELFTSGKMKSINGFHEILKYLRGQSELTFNVIIQCAFISDSKLLKKQNIAYSKELHRALNEKFDELLDENSVFIYPTFPTTAPYHKGILPFLLSVTYMNVFNLTQMPVTQCPMGTNRNGMPLGIQIAGKKNNDALTIACASELEKAFGGWIAPEKVQDLKKFD